MRYYRHQFPDKRENFEFFGLNLLKNGFWSRNFKTRDMDSESASTCTNFQAIGTILNFLALYLPENGFWGRNFENLSLDSESTFWGYYVHQFSEKTDNFEFLGLNLLKNGFWDRNYKILGLDSESVSLRYY